MQKRDGQGETKVYTKSGEEEAKGGAKMQKINREDVVQAALIVERWCVKHIKLESCDDCPFDHNGEKCALLNFLHPCGWNLELYLRTRGIKRD